MRSICGSNIHGEQAEAKLRGEVNEIQKEILSIEQIPQNLAYVLEFSIRKKMRCKFY